MRKRAIYCDGYFKASRRLLDSSLWCEHGDVVKVFLYLLAVSQDPGGPRNGTVYIAKRQLAAKCFLSEERLAQVETILAGPDAQSRTQQDDGRRVEVLPNGYRILNYGLYHDRSKDEALSRMRSDAGAIGGRKSAEARKNQRDKSKQKRSKPEAKRSYGDGDGDGERNGDGNGNGFPPAAGKPAPVDPPWSREAADVWIETKLGKPPGKLFGMLLPLVRAEGWERVRPALRYYLSTTGAEFVRIDKFTGAFGEWEKRARGAPPPGGAKQTSGESTMAAAGRVLARHQAAKERNG